MGPVVVYVDVTVEPDGHVSKTLVTKSSNNMAVDQAAVKAARATTYSPKIMGCQAMTGIFIFRADFRP